MSQRSSISCPQPIDAVVRQHVAPSFVGQQRSPAWLPSRDKHLHFIQFLPQEAFWNSNGRERKERVHVRQSIIQKMRIGWAA